jgi:tetratricopeptide (TPR) repeat protein
MYIARKSASRFLKKMKFRDSRVLKALRLATYPAFEPAAARHFEALRREAENARNAGDLAGAEKVYLRAMAEARVASDPSHLSFLRHGLAQVYQDQGKYPEAELILREHLEEALKSPQANTQVHAAHMGLALLYQKQGNVAQAEEHYTSALAETEKPEVWPNGEFYCSTALWLARFYVEHHRYHDAEPLFLRVLEIREADRPSLPHYLQELAKVYEAQEKYAAAEESYRRALKIAEELDETKEFVIVRALGELARFCQERGRYSDAEDFSRRCLAIVEEKIQRHSAEDTNRLRRRPDDKNLEARIKHARVPISEALDRLAGIYEAQEKYPESEPLRRRSLEIKVEAWGENNWIWADSLAAHANALHKIGREDEATKLDEQLAAIRAKYPEGSVRSYVHLTSRPLKRTLRGRFRLFIHALRYPSPR